MNDKTIIRTFQVIAALIPFLLVFLYLITVPDLSTTTERLDFWLGIAIALLIGFACLYKLYQTRHRPKGE